MHIEFLVADSSGACLLNSLLPQVLGINGHAHTWRSHAYKGIGRIPKDLPKSDPAKRILLDQLPRLLRGYGKTPGIDAVVVLLDADQRNCKGFLDELVALAARCRPIPSTMFRLAIEEVEAWYFGDIAAMFGAYPRARRATIDSYAQDSICGTWELLADAIFLGGSAAVKKQGWPLPGQLKYEWAERIGPRMVLERNLSPSCQKFRNGIRRLVG